jgi:hypothetical protein
MIFGQVQNSRQRDEANVGRLFGLWMEGLDSLGAHLFPHFQGVKIIWRNTEYRRKNEKLLIGDVAKTDFDLTQGGTADVKAGHLATASELLLAKCQLAARFPNLWADHIGRMFFSWHGSTKSSLTLFEKPIKHCYARVTEHPVPIAHRDFRTRD